jgi:hypothetical protein
MLDVILRYAQFDNLIGHNQRLNQARARTGGGVRPKSSNQRLGPVLDCEARDPREMPNVVGHETHLERHGVSGDQRIHFADGRPSRGEEAPDAPEFEGGLVVERSDVDRPDEGVNEGVKLARSLALGAEPELRECNGADSDVGRARGENSGSDRAHAT